VNDNFPLLKKKTLRGGNYLMGLQSSIKGFHCAERCVDDGGVRTHFPDHRLDHQEWRERNKAQCHGNQIKSTLNRFTYESNENMFSSFVVVPGVVFHKLTTV
jgi:hypothetical protein